MATADTIASSLPEGSSDNAYAFSRAAFDYLHAYVSYDREAPSPARSGPACLAAGTGDCDEQTNAFFSTSGHGASPAGMPLAFWATPSFPTKDGKPTPGATFNCP